MGNRTFLIPDNYQNCVLEEFSRFELNHDARVRCGYGDRLGVFNVEFVCRHKQIRVQIPSGGELPTQPDVSSWSLVLTSAARARRQLQYSGAYYSV